MIQHADLEVYLLEAAKMTDQDCTLYGMESNNATWNLCRMNMFLHELDDAQIKHCNTLKGPDLVKGRSVIRI